MGRVWGVDAVAKNDSTSFYGTIVALAESPLVEGLIYAGTDDGLIQVTEDGGQTWRKVENFPFTNKPADVYVSDIETSRARSEHGLRMLRQPQERRFQALSCCGAPIGARAGSTSAATCPSADRPTRSPSIMRRPTCCSSAPSSASSRPATAASTGIR